MTEIEGINQGDPGDVLVIQGVRDISNMGGIMASLAHAAGARRRRRGRRRPRRRPVAAHRLPGLVARRQPDHRQVALRDASRSTGRSRCAASPVRPGDLVIADETGTCFVPHALIEKVLPLAEAIDAQGSRAVAKLDAGLPFPHLAGKRFDAEFPHQPK